MLPPFFAHAFFAAAVHAHADTAWQDGFDGLRERMFTSDTAEIAYAMLNKSGIVRWVDERESHIAHEETFASPIQGFAEEALERDEVGALCQIRVRPFFGVRNVFRLHGMNVEEAVRSRRSSLSLPPTLREIDPFSDFGTLHVKGLLEKQEAKLVQLVMDPSRIWRFREATDKDLQRMPELLQKIREQNEIRNLWDKRVIELVDALAPETIERLLKYASLSDQEFIAQISEHYIMQRTQEVGLTENLDMREIKEGAIISALFDGEAHLSAAIMQKEADRKRQRDLERVNGDILQDQNALDHLINEEWVPASKQGEPPEELLQQLEEAYLRVGSVVESFPLEEMRQHPEFICR